ncbi:MAG TPA: COX15/CtaA family protein, partial [Gammaproteobacteria bacterium]|nr:COX15/CtaA family protein [Gammaproteobacteria bacterium]
FQAALGMWTVTLQLKPIIVMGHLMGGMLTLSLLFWLALSSSQKIQPYRYAGHVKQWMVGLALFLVILQIMLGGWTSSNYAALSCVGFPLCNGQLWPDMNFSEAFVMWRGLGVNYEFGVLDAPSRVAIQMAHRLGFVVVTLYLAWLTTRLMKNRELMPLGVTVAGLLLLQITLGIVNVTFSLPLAVATAHNGVAALLLLSLVALLYKTRKS